MSKCENCRLRKESAKAFDIHWHDEVDCPYAKCPVPDFPQTNADRIRAMTDEELADYHTKMCGCPPGHDPIFCGMATIGCKGCWLDWLKATVEVDE